MPSARNKETKTPPHRHVQLDDARGSGLGDHHVGEDIGRHVGGFGRGPWDERFGAEDNHLSRLYVGDELARLEEEEKAAGMKIDPWTWI